MVHTRFNLHSMQQDTHRVRRVTVNRFLEAHALAEHSISPERVCARLFASILDSYSLRSGVLSRQPRLAASEPL